MEMESSSSSKRKRYSFEVFLSFRVEDTCRTTFISHLFNAFDKVGINVFKDDPKLERGRSIAPELLNAIRQSKFFVVVLSKNYADSSWCLNELTEIMSCLRNDMGCNVYPVFYDVDPSDVRKQKGEFGEAFAKLEQTNSIENWRAALTNVANLAGFTLRNSEEADVVRTIVEKISKKLRDSYSSTVEIGHGLVGIDEKLNEFKEKLRQDLPEDDNARFIESDPMKSSSSSKRKRYSYEVFLNEFQKKLRLDSPEDEMESSSSKRKIYLYEVFLSFRGEDTRHTTFISHLFTAFKTVGINVFKDDQKLERGRSIAPELLYVIRRSKFFVVVLSKNYADSSWCLNELTEIMSCLRNDMGCNVYPVFYDVDPSDVRKQKGEFGEAFAKLEQTNSIENWRAALTNVANLAGFTLRNSEEADVVRTIVEMISKKLRDSYSSTVEIGHGLVGIDEKLNEFKEKLRLDSPEDDDARFIGICGEGGIGKSTLARVAFDSLSTHFDGKSYLSNVRGKNPTSLQMQILSEILKEEIVIREEQDGANIIRKRLCNRKVLVVIDDVDNKDQLQYLAGDQKWFGLGSRIIITSRDAHLLEICGIKTDDIYKPKHLNNDESLKLLRWKAFKSGRPVDGFLDLCNSLVDYADGLPLALEVLGSFLHGKTIIEWKTAIDRLKIEPEDRIFNSLRVSFNGLKETEKNIFLDIACFFNGESCDYVTEVPKSSDSYPGIGIRVLVEKSFLTIKDDILSMHDLLQDMGQKIVFQESPYEPGKRTRLWKEDDIRHVLTGNTGTEVVEGIMLPWFWSDGKAVSTDANVFLNMKRLRLLKISTIVFPHDLAYFPGNLQLLDWKVCPARLFPASFQPNKLVHLRMPCSSLVELWEEPVFLLKLKSMDLSHSKNLKKMPNLENALNLQSLNFEGCTQLSSVHSSIGDLRSLTTLVLRNCSSLKRLSNRINGMKSLEHLDLFGCSELDELPEDLGEVKCLKHLNASKTAIRKLPSVTGLTNLTSLRLEDCPMLLEISESVVTLQTLAGLYLSGCSSLKRLSNRINDMKSLEYLDLSGCFELDKLPEDLGEVKCLKHLNASKTATSKLPSVTGLTNLTSLELEDCPMLLEIPESVVTLETLAGLNLSGCSSLKQLPNRINGMKSLESLDLSGCFELDKLPEDLGEVECLKYLDASKTAIRKLPSVTGLTNLTTLRLGDCPMLLEIPESVVTLQTLAGLYLSGCSSLKRLPNKINCMKSLEYLDLSGCSELDELPEDLGEVKCLKHLDASKTAIRKLPSVTGLTNLTSLLLEDCPMLLEIHESVGTLKTLKWLNLKGCRSLENLPRSVNGWESLEILRVSGCSKLKKLPEDLGVAKLLEELNLSETAITELPSSIAYLPKLSFRGWKGGMLFLLDEERARNKSRRKYFKKKKKNNGPSQPNVPNKPIKQSPSN